MISGSIVDCARPPFSAFGGVFQSSVSKAPQLSQTGRPGRVDVVALAADPLRPARGAERLGEPAAHHRLGRALAAFDRRHDREAARGRLGLGEVAERLAGGGKVLVGEREFGGEQPALGMARVRADQRVEALAARPPAVSVGSIAAKAAARSGCGLAAQAVVSTLVALRVEPSST